MVGMHNLGFFPRLHAESDVLNKIKNSYLLKYKWLITPSATLAEEFIFLSKAPRCPYI